MSTNLLNYIKTVVFLITTISFCSLTFNCGRKSPAEPSVNNYYYTNSYTNINNFYYTNFIGLAQNTNTTMSGTISTNEIWYGNLSLTGNVIIQSETVLWILKNTRITTPASFSLTVYGWLYIHGGVGSNIIVFSNTGIIASGSGTIYATNFQIMNASIILKDISQAYLDNLYIYSNSGAGIATYGESRLTINNSQIIGSSGNAFYISGNSSAYINACSMGKGIARGVLCDANAYLLLSDSLVSNCTTKGITAFQNSTLLIARTDIIGNGQKGISVNYGTPYIHIWDSYIAYNNGATNYTVSSAPTDSGSGTNIQFQFVSLVSYPNINRKTTLIFN